MSLRQQRLEEFTSFYEIKIKQWHNAMITGDTSSLEADMVEDYKVFFFKKEAEAPDIFTAGEAIAGMRDSVSALPGAQKKFENKQIRLRSDDEAIVFYEQLLEKEGNVLVRLFTFEIWKYIEGKWKIIREVVEPAS